MSAMGRLPSLASFREPDLSGPPAKVQFSARSRLPLLAQREPYTILYPAAVSRHFW